MGVARLGVDSLLYPRPSFGRSRIRSALEAVITRAELPALKGALDGNAMCGSTSAARLEDDFRAAA
jgi:hypothetical protein